MFKKFWKKHKEIIESNILLFVSFSVLAFLAFEAIISILRHLFSFMGYWDNSMQIFLKELDKLFLIISILMIIILILILLILWQMSWKSYKFSLRKDVFNGKEYDKFLKKKNRFRDKKYLRGTVSFYKDFWSFFLFSLIFGIFWMGRPFWLFSSLKRVIQDSLGYRKKGRASWYVWRKVFVEKEKDYLYYPFVLPLNKNKN